jgi:hypothetical protein
MCEGNEVKQLDQLTSFRWGQTGCGLIKQNQARRAGQGNGNFELSLLAMRQIADQFICNMGQASALSNSWVATVEAVVFTRSSAN